MGISHRGLSLYVVAAFFAAMGLAALAAPEFVVHFFGVRGLPLDMRNEVRAVYGGFGVAVAVVLCYTRAVERRRPAYALGMRSAVMMALVGMAGGRVVSLGVERTDGPWPITFMAAELALAFLLYVAMPESGLTRLGP
jgi:hypothetical protein